MRQLQLNQAINEALEMCLERYPEVFVMGLGVTDPKGVFGTTSGLCEKFGEERVMDMPVAENGMTGVAIGSALTGMRPVIVHQRLDFAMLAVEQMVNQAANWHYMYGGQVSIPLVVRLIVGRGWGQGPQHSQSLHSWFAHIPGLKVVMPATAHDAKGLLAASIADDNPVIFIEHRWTHHVTGAVPEGWYTVPIGAARRVRAGSDLTIVSLSYMLLESLRAAEMLAATGIEADVIDLRSLRPLDTDTILASARKTGRLLVVDSSWRACSVGSELIARVAESESLKTRPARIALPDCPSPATPGLSKYYYPRAIDIAERARKMLNSSKQIIEEETALPLDVPDPSFSGPF